MTAQNIGSASIIALDTIPVLKPDTGQGAAGELQQVNDYVAVTTAGLGSTSSSYQLLRLPSTAKLKSLSIFNDTLMDTGGLAAALVLYIGAQYSDAPKSGNVGTAGSNGPIVDGTVPSNAGVVIAKNAFGSVTNPAAGTETKVVPFGSSPASWGQGASDNIFNAMNEPLWQALGLTSDPGGFIDITVYVHTAANTAAAGNIAASASYVM